jgi:threonine dehydratase
VAYGLDVLNAAGTIFVPANANNSKVEAIKRLGAEVHYFGNDTAETETHARRYAKQHNMTYVSPYNDLKVIGGQGTIGVELIRQLSQIDVVFISLGGGGMISGIVGYAVTSNSVGRYSWGNRSWIYYFRSLSKAGRRIRDGNGG